MLRDEIEHRLRDFFAARPGVAAVYLFGSVARGTEHAGSDVDVGVLFETTPRSRLDAPPLELEDALERALGRTVQLVTLNTAPADLRIRVLRDRRLIVDPNPSVRIRFEVATRKEYFDLEPLLRAYRAPIGADHR